MTMQSLQDIETGLLGSRERLSRLRQRRQSYLTAEEAREYGFDLEPDWAVKVDWDETVDRPKYTFISPERWEFGDLVYGGGGEIREYTALSPEGKRYTKAELEGVAAPAITEELATPREQRNYATQQQFELLKQYKAEGTLAEKQLSTDLWLSERQARELGYQTTPGQDFRLSALAPREGRLYGGIPAPATPYISQLVQRIYPEKFEVGKPAETVLQDLSTLVTEDTEGFLNELRGKGRSADTENLLRMIVRDSVHADTGQPFTSQELDELVDDVFDGAPQVSEVGQAMMEALPELVRPNTLEWAEGYYGRNLDKLRGELITAGRNNATEKLVKRLYPSISEQGLKDYFSLDIPEEKVTFPTFETWLEQKGFTPEVRADLETKGGKEGLEASLRELKATYEYEFGRGRWGTSIGELEKIAISDPKKLRPVAKVFGQSLLQFPRQWGAAVLQATQGQGGASVVDKDWADKFIEDANTDLEKFVQEISRTYPDSRLMTDIASFSPNLAYSMTSMGAGLIAGVPIALIPEPTPASRVLAWTTGSAVSGAVAYSMTTYQIMQTYLEAKNDEKIAATGRGITGEEEAQLKKDFEAKAREYGLWEAIPEAISNLAFARLLTTPLTKMVGGSIAKSIVGKLGGIYGEELLTETVTQKGQSAIEVEAGLREGKISWGEAFREVAPQTFLLTTILGGVGSVSIASVNKVKQSLKTEIGTDHPLYQVLLQEINRRQIEILQQGAMEQGGKAAKVPPEGIPPIVPKPITPAPKEPKLPKAEPGMPEAGLQPSMLPEEVAAKEVRPTGKGRITQISMDEQLKLQQQIEAAKAELSQKGRLPSGEKRADVQLNIANLQAQKDVAGFKSLEELETAIGEVQTEISLRGQPYHGGVSKNLFPDMNVQQLSEMLKVYEEAKTQFPIEAKPSTEALGAKISPVEEEVKAIPPEGAKPAPPTIPERAKQIQSELEADIAIAKKKIADIKTPLPTQGTDVQFARLALNDAERVLSRNKSLISRIERGQEISQDEINALNDELASVKDALLFQIKDVAKARTYLTQYVSRNVPLAERGKLLTAIAKIQGAQDIQVVMERANQLAEQFEKKRLRAEIIKELKRSVPRKEAGIVKGRFGGDIQTELDKIKANLDMSRDAALAQQVSNQQAYDEGRMTYEDMVTENIPLNFAGIKEMTIQELQDTLDYIKTEKEIGRSIRFQQLDKFKQEMNAAKKDIIEVITGGKPVEPGVIKEHHGLGAFWEKIENGQIALTDFLDKLSRFSKSKPYQSALNRFVDNRVLKSYNSEQNGLVNQQKEIRENLERIFGSKKTGELNDILRRMGRDKVNLGTFKNTEGKEVKLELTKGQIIDAYNLIQAEQNLATFKEGNKWTSEMMDAIKNGLTSEEKAWADWTRSYLADYWTSINDVYEPLYGVKLGRNENYWPRNRDVEKSDIPEHILVQEDYNHFASVTNGSLKARTNNKIPFKFLDGNAKLINHVTQMEHFKAWAFTIRDLRSMFMSRDVRDAINQYHGKGILGKVNDYINILARGGIEKSKRVAALDTLRGNVAVSVLGVKPMIAVKQPTALLAYAVGMPYKDFTTGVANFLSNPLAKYKILYEKSSSLRARYRVGQYERDLKVGVEGGAPRSISDKANWKENMLTLIQLGDKFGTVPGMWAKYQSSLKEGMSDADAILEAEKLTNRTQNTSQLFSLSTLQHGGSWARLMTMFQDQPNKYFRLINSNARNLINGREGKAKAITSIAILWVVIPSLFQFMGDAFKWRPERQARAVILGPINDLLVFGQMAQSVVGWVTGEQFPYEPSPVLQIADDVKFAISKMQKLIRDGQDPFKDIKVDDVLDMIEFLAKAGGMAIGMPTPYLVQVERALRGEEGNVDLRELLFSRWALEEPTADLKKKARDTEDKLGTIILEGVPADKEPPVFDTAKTYSEWKEIFKRTLPSDITVKKGFTSKQESFSKTLLAEEQYKSFAGKPLYEIIEDIEKDNSFNYNISQYYADWQVRLKVDSLEKVKEWDKEHPNGEWGNLTPGQYKLLLKYEQADKAGRLALLESNPELKLQPNREWLKSHPKENAQLAVWGQAKILTREAYNEFKSLVKSLDIPDSALPEMTLPPEGSIDSYFKYQDMVADDKSNSWEAQLLLAQDNDLRDWLGREPIETPPEALELKIKNREFSEQYDALTTDEERGKLKLDNPEWVDDMRRVEAIENNGIDLKDDWVARGKVVDEFGASSSEAKVWLLDNPEVQKWALENKLLNDDGSGWNEKVLRLSVQMRGMDKTSEQYVTLSRQKEAYSLGFPEKQIENYSAYYDLPSAGKRQERFLINNPEFASLMVELKGVKIPSPADVPNVAYDDIYDKYEQQFKQYEAANAAGRQRIFAENPAFKEAYYRRKAYGELWEEKYVSNYVTYALLPEKGYAKERFLSAHQDFYLYAKKKLKWKTDIDFDKIPGEGEERMPTRAYRKTVTSSGLAEEFIGLRERLEALR